MLFLTQGIPSGGTGQMGNSGLPVIDDANMAIQEGRADERSPSAVPKTVQLMK